MCTKHTPEEYKALMLSMDINRDGKVTWEEFVAAAIDKIVLLNERNIEAAFNVLDKNGDGQITLEEMNEMFEWDKKSN